MQPKKIDYYSIQLLKQNIPYIVSFFIFILVLVYVGFFYFVTIPEKDKKIADLQRENDNLINNINITKKYKVNDLNNLYKMINSLVPDKEDYFSIVSAIENLTSKTNYKINAYSIAFSKNPGEKLTLRVEGQGSLSELLDFLEKYQYEGGRLITIDGIEFLNKDSQSILNLNFYSKKVTAQKKERIQAIDNETMKFFNKINQTFSNAAVYSDNSEVSGNDNYTNKENPFRY